jgi:hypothetical protein
MTVEIPLVITPSQTLSVTLNNQAVRLKIYQKRFGLFVDVLVNDALVVGGVIARNRTKIVRDAYLGLAGDFYFYDTHGASDPDFSQLGTRFKLYYK